MRAFITAIGCIGLLALVGCGEGSGGSDPNCGPGTHDENGQCVPDENKPDTPSPTDALDTTSPPNEGCTNASQDGTETDVDCGGSECLPCGVGEGCKTDSDCETNKCEAGVCAIPVATECLTEAPCVDDADCEKGQRCNTFLTPPQCQVLYCSGDGEACDPQHDDALCEPGSLCLADGLCCAPACDGMACGADGCGGTCGECLPEEICITGQCCTPDCSGKQCGADGCGGSCGSCNAPQVCNTSATCGCAEPLKKGWNCDECTNPKFTGPKCDECAPQFTGPTCDQCSDPVFTGTNCDQCSDPMFTGTNCDQCDVGTTNCKTADLLETCGNDGNITVESCDKGCFAGQCIKLCVPKEPNAIFCTSGETHLLKCDDNGVTAQIYKECEYGCDPATTTCNATACDPGDTKCADDGSNIVEICNSMQTGWIKAPTPCKDKCKNGECTVLLCETDAILCGSLGVEKCNESQTGYDLIEPCEWGCLQSDSEAICALCAPGEVKCDYQTVKFCDSPFEGWVTAKECSELQSCADGDCTNVVTLKAQNPPAANYLLLTKAFVDCWKGKQVGACRAINTTGLTVDISALDISSWFCASAQESDFASQDDYGMANDIMGCGAFNLEDMDFQTNVIHADLNGVECIGFYTDWMGDGKINIKNCDDF